MSSNPPLRFSHSHHLLAVKGCESGLDVLAFEGDEALSKPFRYRIEFTSADHAISKEMMLMKGASLTLQAPVDQGYGIKVQQSVRVIQGVVSGLERLGTSKDETRYALTLEPRLALLDRSHQNAIYQDMSVPQILEKILRERHGLRGQDFLFSLSKEYPRREQVMQYGENDLHFITRLLGEVGIWFRFTTDTRLNIDVVEFYDSQQGYEKALTLPSVPPSGQHSKGVDSVWKMESHHNVVQKQVSTRDYNYRQATEDMNTLVDATGGDTTTYGDAYHWADTEVAIGFEDGNPDRPYIAGVLHDSAHGDHVTIRNYKRNVLRTPANNKIRLDDERGKEHIKVSTEYGGKSQLNLGHLVDSEKQQRGEGFELRTDSWGAIRAQKGIFISADGQAKAQGLQREMQAALKELDAAREVTSGLRHAAQAAQAELADLEKQTTLMNQTLNDLKQQALLLSAPSGIAQVTPASLQVSAGENLIVTAGQNADISIVKKFTLAVGDILSLFAHKLGIKIYASEGKVDIQAQSDELNLFAKEKLSVASSNNSVVISAKKEILLVCGGSFMRLSDAGVEVGTGKNVTLKCIAVQQQSTAKLNSTLSLPSGCKPGVISAAQQQGAVVILS